MFWMVEILGFPFWSSQKPYESPSCPTLHFLMSGGRHQPKTPRLKPLFRLSMRGVGVVSLIQAIPPELHRFG